MRRPPQNRGRPGITKSGALNQGIEHAYRLPVLPVLLDELVVQGSLLVPIVGCPIGEYDVQPYIKGEVIDLSVQLLGPTAAGKENRAGMPGQVLHAGLNQSLPGCLGAILQR